MSDPLFEYDIGGDLRFHEAVQVGGEHFSDLSLLLQDLDDTLVIAIRSPFSQLFILHFDIRN